MANYCENYMNIYGNKEDLKAFIDDYIRKERKTYIIDFTKAFHPKERVYLKTLRDPSFIDECKAFDSITYSDAATYANFLIGTESYETEAFTDLEMEFVKGNIYELQIDFDTKWSSPLNWVVEASKRHKSIILEIKYEEEGMGFGGNLIVRNGYKLTTNCEIKYNKKRMCCDPYNIIYKLNGRKLTEKQYNKKVDKLHEDLKKQKG